ncbi:MAG: DNA repair protein RecO [Methylobacteriaceae bacterium]|jgi:DNA repair protein RecO (recombination protein O)|nr:DNA repair protein RecO [Methylobacteriaceae bacterium]
MQWHDEGIILGTRRFGETSVIADVFTRGHGRAAGLVPGGVSRKISAVLQGGNSVEVVWRARLEEHLGQFKVEPLVVRSAALFASPLALNGFGALAALLRFLPERDPHEELFRLMSVAVEHLADEAISPLLFIKLELMFLAAVGFGLDLSECAATGTRDNLVYVSPKSGRAVSAAAGEPYRQKLLALPGFVRDSLAETGALPRRVPLNDLAAGFALTEFFLNKCLFEPQGVECPGSRRRFVALVLQNR